MISTAFEYSRATSVDDALAKLRAANGEAKLLAGGHSLIPVMKFRLSEPKMLIDIGRIPELSGIRKKGDKIEIGAGTVHHDVATSAMLQQECPMIAEAAATIGDPQVRNRGTLGGSIAHADPSADYPAAMLALDADIHIKGLNGARVVKARDFFRGLFTVDLAADETHRRRAVRAREGRGVRQALSAGIPLRDRRSRGGARREQRRDHVRANRRDRSKLARHAPDGRGRRARRASLPSARTIAAAVRTAGATLEDLNSDIHASKEYRRAMIPVFTRARPHGRLERAADRKVRL